MSSPKPPPGPNVSDKDVQALLQRLRCPMPLHALRTLLPVALREETEVSYAELGRQLGKSEDAIKKAIERLRARWEALVREEVAATVQSTEDVETELRELLALVSSR